jgi:pimeloyl-ACP methyl ester carboxylesterase
MGTIIHWIGLVVVALAGAAGLLFVAMFLWTRGVYPVPRTAAEDLSVPRITIDGVTLHGESVGDPRHPVVIVVHGGPGWDYRALLPLRALADEYRVVFYDQRGTGLSPRVETRELSLESSLTDLDAIVTHFGRGTPVRLVGHSWGAMLVSGYLGRHAERVSHAVLAEPGFLTSDLAQEAGIRFGPRWEVGFLAYATRVGSNHCTSAVRIPTPPGTTSSAGSVPAPTRSATVGGPFPRPTPATGARGRAPCGESWGARWTQAAGSTSTWSMGWSGSPRRS